MPCNGSKRHAPSVRLKDKVEIQTKLHPALVQRQAMPEEEEKLQSRLQRQAVPEEEEEVQAKSLPHIQQQESEQTSMTQECQ